MTGSEAITTERDGPTLGRFLDEADAPSRSLVVLNRTTPEPVWNLLERTFGDQPVGVDETETPDTDEDVVVAVEHQENGPRVVATSPMRALSETILLVNSDLYRTGAFEFETYDLPDVLVALDEVPFRVEGYPRSNKEKLPLIAVSRAIEAHAYRAGAGTLRASFQRLSRLSDERGTRAVYERLADTDVRTHVYGVPDRNRHPSLDVEVHTGHTADYRRGWFVVYEPPGAATPDDPGSVGADPVAMLAVQRDDGAWDGFWTFDPTLVSALDDHVDRAM